MKNKKFKLSPAGKLTVVLSLILTQSSICYANGIVAGGDAAHRPDIYTTENNVPIINIVTPSSDGVSHNQYDEFNVDRNGTIFNNSASNSSLGGGRGRSLSIEGNKNLQASADTSSLHGNPARVILNEVIGSNDSILAGHQQVIGNPTDYILANENGISCDGCSFDPNFSQVTLVVGKPVVDDGRLQEFDSTSNTNRMTIKNTREAYMAKVLTLITPTINADSHIMATEAVNVIVGKNKFSKNNEIIHAGVSGSPDTLVDGYFLGSIAANRIRLHDTRQRNSLILQGNITASEELDISAVEGTVRLKSDTLDGGSINIHAKDIIAEKDISSLIGGNNRSNYINMRGSTINITARDNNQLTGVRVSGHNVSLKGSTLTIDGLAHEDNKIINSDKQGDGIGDKITSQTASEKYFSEGLIRGYGGISMESTNGDLILKGVHIEDNNGSIKLNAQRDVLISGLKSARTDNKLVELKDIEPDLQNGNIKQSKEFETLTKTIIKSKKNTEFIAGRDTRLAGVEIKAAGELKLKSKGSITITPQEIKKSNENYAGFTQWGALGGSEKHLDSKRNYKNQQSDLIGSNIYIDADENISIISSKVNANNLISIKSKKDMLLNGLLDKETVHYIKETGGVFNIITNSNKKTDSNESFIDTEIKSNGDIYIDSNGVFIDGALINAEGKLKIKSTGNVIATAARQQQKIDEEKSDLNWQWYAKKQGDKQYRAGFEIKHVNDKDYYSKLNHHVATLTGGEVNISAEKDIRFFGTAIKTNQGDLTLSAGNGLQFLSAVNSNMSSKERTIYAGGAHYDGGIDKFGSGAEIKYNNKKNYKVTDSSIGSKTDINGNMKITAKEDITHQGANHRVSGEYHENAKNIYHMASNDKTIFDSTEKEIKGGVGFNIDYSKYTRQIEKIIKDPMNTLQHLGGKGSLKGISDPNLGLDVYGSGDNKTQSGLSSLALVTEVQASDIILTAQKDVMDVGTQYKTKGKDKNGGIFSLEANRHFSNAAINYNQEKEDNERGGAGVRVSTTTGKDVKVTLSAKGETSEGNKYVSTMLPSFIKADGNVLIKTMGDTYYQATDIFSARGKVQIKSDGDIHFEQVIDNERNDYSRTHGKGKLTLGGTVTSKEFSVGLGGEYQKSHGHTSNAQVSQIKSQHSVILQAANITLKGTKIGDEDAKVGNVDMIAGQKLILGASLSDSANNNLKAAGNVRTGVKIGSSDTDASKMGFVGGDGQADKIKESTIIRKGINIHSNGSVLLQAGSNDNQAIYTQGLQLNSQQVEIHANNGGVFMESSLNVLPKDNWDFDINADLVLTNKFGKDSNGKVDKNSSSKSHYTGAGIKAGVNTQDIFEYTNTSISTDSFSLQSHKNTHMLGVDVNTNKASVNVGGDLHIESQKDRQNIVNVAVDFALSHTNDKSSSVVSKISKIGTKRFEGKIKGVLTSGIDKAGTAYNKKFPGKDIMGGVVFNKDKQTVELPALSNKTTSRNFADKTARFLGNNFKTGLTDPAGLAGHAKLDISLVKNDAIDKTSGIFAQKVASVTVLGKTVLKVAQINNASGIVTLNINELHSEDMKNNTHRSGGGFNLAPTVMGVASAGVSDAAAGKIPFIHSPYITHGISNVPGGIFHDMDGEFILHKMPVN
ncbi:hemagglutinin repeat-containing protein [Yersinia proxima]|uniref:hemagglutinin repeat-containing protein n=1 Tax=Yersinia proxima TaxID=2890316 RepID=UPI0037D87F9A